MSALNSTTCSISRKAYSGICGKRCYIWMEMFMEKASLRYFIGSHSLESYFIWYHLSEDWKLFFAEFKLKRTVRVWWSKYQQAYYVTLRSWEEMKVAIKRYFVPAKYKQLVHLQCTQLVRGRNSVEEYTSKLIVWQTYHKKQNKTKNYRLAARSEFPWNEHVMISMYWQGLKSSLFFLV